MLPERRNTTYAPLSQLQSLDLNDVQDLLIRGHAHPNFTAIAVDAFSGATFADGDPGALGFQPDTFAAPAAAWRFGLAMAAGAGTPAVVLRSMDGYLWLRQPVSGDHLGVEHHKAMFYSVAVGLWIMGTKDGSVDEILTTADISGAWTPRADTQVGTNNHGGMSESATTVVMPGEIEVLHSTDGITWSHNGTAQTRIRSSAYSASLDLFVVVGDAGKVDTADGVVTGGTWTDRSAGVPAPLAAVDFLDVAWDPTFAVFVAVAAGGKAMVSSDGITWTDKSISTISTDNFKSIVSDGAGILYATSAKYIWTSYDGGLRWVVSRLPSAVSLPFVFHADERAVLCGAGSESDIGLALAPRQSATPTVVIAP